MCTDFSIKALSLDPEKAMPVIGRSMELGPNLKSELFFRAKDFKYTQEAGKALTPPSSKDYLAQFIVRDDIAEINKHLYSWSGKYGFVAMNGFEKKIANTLDVSTLFANIATNGMNTEGLTTGSMVLAQSEYQHPIIENGQLVNAKAVIYYPSITTWILANCANCQDVINGLQHDQLVVNKAGSNLSKSTTPRKDQLLVASPFDKVPNAMKFHFPVHDAHGNSIVLEYANGQLTITDLNPIGVLTNDPLIGWQQENVNYNYVNVVPFNFQNEDGEPDVPSAQVYQKATRNFQCNSYAQGTGFSGVPGSSTPVDRFVRASMMTNFSFPVFQLLNEQDIKEANAFKDIGASYLNMYQEPLFIDTDIQVGKADATTLAFHILNTVDIPLGTSRDSQGKSVHDFTQWVTVADLVNKTFSIRMYQSPQVFSINLNELYLSHLEGQTYQLDESIKSIDITSTLNKISPEISDKEIVLSKNSVEIRKSKAKKPEDSMV